MAFEIDTGNSVSNGPWLQWSARGTQDGSISPKSFYLREGSDKTPFAGFNTGVVLDIEKMKTGWQRSEGVIGQAPDWKWNATVSHMQPKPGEDFKNGFSIPCAIGGGNAATWEQAGAATWNAFMALVPGLQQQPAPNMLPLVKLTGTKFQQFKRGSTVEPILEIIKWVPRPDCLKEGAAAGVAVEAMAQPAPRPAPKPTPQPIPDDAEF